MNNPHMQDAVSRLRARGWQPSAPIETPKAPGDRVIGNGRCYTVRDNGTWQEHVVPISHPAAGPAVPLHISGWKVLGGLLLGAVFVLLFLALMVTL